MATGKRDTSKPAREADDRFHAIGEQASATVRQAADVFEQELSSGLEEARRLQRRFTERGRLEPGDLSEVVARVRSNAHGLIDTAAARFNDMAADDVQDLVGRFTNDAHEVFDALMDLVDSSPPLINRLLDGAGSLVQAGTGTTDSASTSEEPSATDAAAGSATPSKRAAPRKASSGRAGASRTAPRKAAPRKAAPRRG